MSFLKHPFTTSITTFIGITLLYLLGNLPGFAQQAADTVAARRFYQEGERFYNRYEDQEALNRFSRADSLLRRSVPNHPLRADIYLKQGVILQYFAQKGQSPYQQAFNAYFTHLALLRASAAPDSAFYRVFTYLGDVHLYLQRNDSARFYYQQAEAVLLGNPDKNFEQMDRLYNSLGALQVQSGNYRLAKGYFEKALYLINTSGRKVLPDIIAKINSNLAFIEQRERKYPDAIRRHLQITTLPVEEKGEIRNYAMLGIAAAYLQLNNYDSALFYYAEVDTARLITEKKLVWLNETAETYAQLGNLALARERYREAIALSQAKMGYQNPYLARSWMGLGKMAYQAGEAQESVAFFDNAIRVLTGQAVADDTSTDAQAISPLTLVEALRGKARALFLLAPTDTAALSSFQRTIALATRIRKGFDSDEAKLFLVENLYPVFEETLAAIDTLYQHTQDPVYLQQAFEVMEKGKAAVLAEALREVRVKAIAGIDPALLEKEQALKQEVARMLIRLLTDVGSDSTLQAMRYHLNQAQISLAKLQESLEANPNYYALKYGSPPAALPALHQYLKQKGAALLSYHYGEKDLFIFAAFGGKNLFVKVPHDPMFSDALKQVRKATFQFQRGAAYPDIPIWLHVIYRQLWEPVAGLVENSDRLIILPDGPLSFFSFDLLVPQISPLVYMIEQRSVSYAFSGGLLLEAASREEGKAIGEILAMAPFAGKGGRTIRSDAKKLYPLAYSRAEIENIGGKLYFSDQATKDLFMEEVASGGYGILHLATHASAEDERPFIAFFPNDTLQESSYKLFTNELYDLKLETVRLVVLSACRASDGKLVRGEGVLSLARAFAHAGCPAIISTLWNADDEATAFIATKLHAYLKAGYEKDDALRKAKLDYLDKKGKGTEPYYWANFILIGESENLYPLQFIYWMLGIGLLLVLLLGARWYQKRARKA
jgi:CHAT domain-containing protein